ncbi:MAG TPA: argininosuccinate lyase [Candidatus Norongarragalinales archaeon]|nr:argininosuccinate lyase [Candidatus Norongarragalinales archaeon]
MVLWKRKLDMQKKLLDFLNRDNCDVDARLLPYDCDITIAYCKALHQAGIISLAELRKLEGCLMDLRTEASRGTVMISPEEEDSHTKIEEYLVGQLGATGKKIHIGKSRNDQALAAVRLFSKSKLSEIIQETGNLAQHLYRLEAEHKNTPMPGYTHMRKAMVSTFGYWCAGVAEGLEDDQQLLKAAFDQNDSSPLGTAAGYGSPIRLNWEEIAYDLGFSRIESNGIHAQNSRGKVGALTSFALSQVMLDINRLATDLMLWCTEEFGFIGLPEELTTGSSIMPHKKNPDVLELLRAKAAKVLSCESHICQLSLNLPSGYNRDIQEMKKPLVEAFETTLASVAIAALVLENIAVNREKMKAAITSDMLSAGRASELALRGVPFRDAYLQLKQA